MSPSVGSKDPAASIPFMDLSTGSGFPVAAGVLDLGATAEKALAEAPFAIESDHLLLGFLQAIVDYEQGDPRPLLGFIDDKLYGLAYGEIWPTIAESGPSWLA